MPLPLGEIQEGYKSGITSAIAQLTSAIEWIDETLLARETPSGVGAGPTASTAPIPAGSKRRVFITHGRSHDWREVQAHIERVIGIPTLELEQEPNQGRTVLQKLEDESSRCDFAVVVMTGDDADGAGSPQARENVIHEIGYLQGKFGLNAVCLLHEANTSIPSNIGGVVYLPFRKGHVAETFGGLLKELNAFYRLSR